MATRTALAVTLDSREPPDLLRSLAVVGGVATTVAPLPAGDCMAICDDAMLLIERKAPNDLLSSIMDGRLFAQVAGMRALTPWVYVVVPGQILPDSGAKCWVDRRPTNFSWHSLQGALTTAQEMGACVLWCAGPDDYLPTLNRLIARSREAVRIGGQRAGALVPADEAILCALPGIGAETARALLAYCGTAAMAISYLSGDTAIDKVPGVGPATRRATRQALGLDETACLHVTMLDGAHAALTTKAEGAAA